MAGADDSWLDEPVTEEEAARIRDPGFWDYIKDIGRAIPSGLEKNVSSYPGTGGDLYDLLGDLAIVEGKLKGNTPEQTQAMREGIQEDRVLPTTEEVHEYLTPEPYKTTTTPGRWTENVTSMIGPRGLTGGLRYLMRDVILPLLASEGGAAAGRTMGPEEEALLSAGAGLSAGPAGEGTKRGVVRSIQGPVRPEPATRMQTLQGGFAPLTPELPNARAERLRRLRAAGIDVTGGQALGSEFIKRMEVGPFSGRGGTLNTEQGRQLTRAALRRVGIDADIASPEVLAAAQNQFGQDYQALVQQNNGITMDPAIEQRLQDIGTQYEDFAGTAQGTAVERFFNRIIDAAAQHGGVIPPDVFNVIHSELSATIQRASKSPELSTMTHALRDMQDAMYEGIGRGQPEIEAAARDLNNRYRNFKIVEKSVGGAGEGVSYGIVSPEKLRAELERRDPSGYRQGRGDLSELARDSQSLAAMPISGTGAQNVTSSLVGLGHAAMVAPVSKVLTSRPVRTSIVNRATGVNPAFFDPMQIAPTMAQANSFVPAEPVPVEEEEPVVPPVVPEVQGALPVPVDVLADEPVIPPGPVLPVRLAELLQGRVLPGRV